MVNIEMLGKLVRNKKILLVVALAVLLVSSAFVVSPLLTGHAIRPSSTNTYVTPSPPRYGAGALGSATFVGNSAVGISDAGKDSVGSYSYHTSSVMGKAEIYNVTGVSPDSSFSIQLNALVTFNVSGELYVYWAQDVATVNVQVGQVSFENNIWNFTSPQSMMYNSSLSGGGRVYPYETSSYYAFSNTSEFEIVPYVFSMKMSVVGDRLLFYSSNDGVFTAFDNVSFFHESPMSFYVSSSPSPFGNPYALEFVVGGFGNGSAVSFNSFDANLSLYRFNGFNYEAVPAAVNYGINTAESATDLNATLGHSAGGRLFSHLTVGVLNRTFLYSRDTVSILSINTTVPGYAVLAGMNFSIPYRNIFTLYPGNYNVTFVSSNHLLYSGNVTLVPGSVYYLMVAPRKYAVTFRENVDMPWYVTVGNRTVYSLNPLVVFALTNGTYAYNVSISPARGNSTVYLPFPSSGSFTVDGKNLTMSISIISPVFLSFDSNHYPFMVDVNGTNLTVDNSASVVVPLNISVVYLPVIADGYGVRLLPFGSPEGYTLNITPSQLSSHVINVSFTTEYLVNVVGEDGPVSWTIGNVSGSSNVSTYVASGTVVNLNASYVYGSLGFESWLGQGNSSYGGDIANESFVARSPVNETAVYSTLYSAVVEVNGFMIGQWTVVTNGRAFHSTEGSITLFVVNGTYNLTFTSELFMKVGNGSATLVVNGSNVTYPVSTHFDFGYFAGVFDNLFIYGSMALYYDILALLLPAGIIGGALARRRKSRSVSD